MISIENEINSTLSLLEGSLNKTTPVIEVYQKDLLYKIITLNYRDKYINRQRRIYTLKSPFFKAREALHGMLGDNIEKISVEEYIDTSVLEEENKKTKNVINALDYRQIIHYFHDTLKQGLKRANNKWTRKKTIPKY